MPDTTSPRGIASLLYKQYPGQQQVDVSCRIEVPGSWFAAGQAGGLSSSERKEKYEAVAMEYDQKHVFEPAAGRKPAKIFEAIRFVCPSDAADDANHAGFWMKLSEWNRYRNDTYKNNRDAEWPYLPATELEAAAGKLAAAPAQQQAADAKLPPPVYKYFTLVKTGKHTVQPKDGTVEAQEVVCEWYECCKKGKGCKVKGSPAIKVVKKATGGLLRHVRVCEGEEVWLTVRSESKGSAVEKKDGKFIIKLSWDELLPHHADFVVYCFQAWDHFSKSRSEPFRSYINEWNERARLPHRNTCVKLLFIIKHLVKSRLWQLLALIKKLLGSPFCGLLDDIWSKRNCKQSFACARIPLSIDGDLLDSFLQSLSSKPLVPKYRGTIVSCSPVLTFSTLPSSRHTGHVIARWKVSSFAETGVLDVRRDVSLATEDGASNNKKSNKVLGLPSRVCSPHDLQRCVLIASGLAGTPTRNKPLKDFQARSSKMVGSFSKSGVATAALMDAQREDDSWNRVVSLSSPNATRWLGLVKQATRNRELQPNISTALCGKEAGKEEDSDSEADSLSDSGSSRSGDEDNKGEVSSDDDLIESKVRANKEFPLSHRLLTNDEFSLNNQWESVLALPGEVSGVLQSHDGTRLEEAHLLMMTLGQATEAPRLQVVSGRGATESWDEMAASRLNQMFKDFRSIFVEEADQRFKLKGTPDEHVLLSLKMSPFIDTSADSMFGKRATQELMEATYKTKLRARQIYMMSSAASASSASTSASASAASAASASASSATASASTSSAAASPSASATTPSSAASLTAQPKKRQKLLALSQSMHSSKKVAVVHNGEADALANEIDAYTKISATVNHDKYEIEGGRYDLNRFWADNKKTLPIHYHVYLGDCGSKRASSASVETVYSGATKLSDDAERLNDDVLAAFVFLHYNWQFEFLRPTIAEIIAEYKRVHGKDAPSEELSDEEGQEEEDQVEED